MDSENIRVKQCTKCLVEKSISDFCVASKNKDGLSCRCKACRAMYAHEWAILNPEKKRATASAWRAANYEKMRARMAQYYAENSVSIKARIAKQYPQNAEILKAKSKKWRAENPEAKRIQDQNRRARKRENGGVISRGLSERLFTLQRGKCACCGKPLGDNYHLDHIMPIALGGSNTDDNIQLLRAFCNQSKRAKHPIDYMQSKGFLL